MIHAPDDSSSRHAVVGPLRTMLLASMLAMLLIGCGPSQVGSDEDVLKTVDALYTAISTRRADLLESCASRIEELHTNGKLPDAAYHQLKPLITEARSGKWDPALRKLYDFMRGQRAKSVTK